MCLSTVYKNKMSPEDIVMKNVMRVECKDGCVILTDLMEPVSYTHLALPTILRV